VIAQSMLDEPSVDYSGVLDELARAERASPADYDIYYLRGKAFLSMDKYQQAIAALRRAIELRPAEAGAYYQLGLAYRRSGQTALAKEQFARVEYLKSQSTAP
jgi:tetratricopeptide (TPR) repeat protein